jgi:hypothetical protein
MGRSEKAEEEEEEGVSSSGDEGDVAALAAKLGGLFSASFPYRIAPFDLREGDGCRGSTEARAREQRWL